MSFPFDEPLRPRNSAFKPPNSKPLSNIAFLSEYTADPKYSFSNFDIDYKRKVGAGGVSDIYIATNKTDNIEYAVKVMPKELIEEQGLTLDIIYKEINVHERIFHPNIIRMYSHYEDNENIYCFLEYIPGTSLLGKIKQKPLTEKEAYYYFHQAAIALMFCHENNLIHRDVKLENFLVHEHTNEVKLCDFGLVGVLNKENPFRVTICGTFDYMAPEMIKEEPYNCGVDVWALGIILYELIHGYCPFGSGIDETAIFKNILQFNFHIDKEITNNCKDLLMKMIQPNEKERIVIQDVLKHPWMNDWVEKKVIDNQRIDTVPGVDDKFANDILDKVEKKNKTKKSKKGDGVKSKKKKVVYKQGKMPEKVNQQEQNIIPVVNDKHIVKEEKKHINKLKADLNSNNNNNNINISKQNVIPLQQHHNEQNDLFNKLSINDSNNERNDVYNPFNDIRSKDNEQETNVINKKTNPFDFSNQYAQKNAFDYESYNNSGNYVKNKTNVNSSSYYNGNNDNAGASSAKKKPKSTIDYKKIDQLNKNSNVFNYAYSNDRMSQDMQLQSTLNMFARAEKLNQDNNKYKKEENESFWSRLIAPFKCGNS